VDGSNVTVSICQTSLDLLTEIIMQTAKSCYKPLYARLKSVLLMSQVVYDPLIAIDLLTRKLI
jgi:hypothetical protein